MGALLVVSLLWGSSFVVIKIASEAFSPTQIATYRVAIAAALLLTIVVIRGYRLPNSGKILLTLVPLSMFGQVLPFVSLGASGHLTSSQNSAIMMGVAPLVTLLLGRFVLPDENWTRRNWAALGIGFTGVSIALVGAAPAQGLVSGFGSDDIKGTLFALLAAFGYSVGAILSRIASRSLSSLLICAITMSISSLILFMYTLIDGSLIPTAVRAEWIAIITLGSVNTALAYVIYFWLIKKAGATFASLNNYIVPVVGIIMGFFVLYEKVSPKTIVGLAFVFVGVAFFQKSTPTGPSIAR